MKKESSRKRKSHKIRKTRVDDSSKDMSDEEPHTLEDESGNPKWFDELSKIRRDFPTCEECEITALKTEAEMVLQKEEEFFSKKAGHNGHGDKSWLRTVMSKGTASDKVAAFIVSVQDGPVYSLPALRTLVNMVKVSKKKECLVVMETLTELFHTDLLRPGRKLLSFEQQPLSILQELSSGNAISRKKYLCHWAFEDQLKILYAQFVNALDVVSKDTVEAHREKAVTAMYKLLSRNPEQEAVLLKNIVNKLGDPSQKVVSKVSYSLTQLLRVHPVMKGVVASEVERFLFRPNIAPRAQYYAVCFLSQYLFSAEDAELAEYIISMYFSFFKSNIKKGDIDSRMMGGLLMGVNRAYPFARLGGKELSQHVDTLYRLVHISSFNISLQTLCLLYQIVGHSNDRFYCALYKKLLDPQLAVSAHQAMFLNLVYKALSKDQNTDRVKVFVKRLLQVCLNGPSHLTCALIYLISQLISRKPHLLALMTRKQDCYQDQLSDDEEENYKDVPLENVNIDSSVNSGDVNDFEKQDGEDVEIKVEEKFKPGWVHCKTTKVKIEKQMFDGRVRNPAFAGGEYAAYEELTALAAHFHPTVALFAKNILDKQHVKYTGDPLHDFTFLRFLERFVFKNPKQLNEADLDRGPDPTLGQRKLYVARGSKSIAINSTSFKHQDERSVPVDELFLYRYLKQRGSTTDENNKKKKDDEDSDADSVGSDEFEELLDNMVGKVDDGLDFADDVGDKLKSKKKSKQQQRESESESDNDMSGDESAVEDEDMTDLEEDGEEGEEVEEGSDAEAIDFGDDGEDLDEEIDFDNMGTDDEEDFDNDERDIGKKSKLKLVVIYFIHEATGQPPEDRVLQNLKPVLEFSHRNQNGYQGKCKKNDIHSMFAPAEKFAEMLEETGASRMKVGTAHDVSNKDNAALKQLEWESKRDHWTRDSGKRKRDGGKRKPFSKQSGKQNFNKAKKKKRS